MIGGRFGWNLADVECVLTCGDEIFLVFSRIPRSVSTVCIVICWAWRGLTTLNFVGMISDRKEDLSQTMSVISASQMIFLTISSQWTWAPNDQIGKTHQNPWIWMYIRLWTHLQALQSWKVFVAHLFHSYVIYNSSSDRICTDIHVAIVVRPDGLRIEWTILGVCVRRAVRVSQRSSEIGTEQNPWNGGNGGLRCGSWTGMLFVSRELSVNVGSFSWAGLGVRKREYTGCFSWAGWRLDVNETATTGANWTKLGGDDDWWVGGSIPLLKM